MVPAGPVSKHGGQLCFTSEVLRVPFPSPCPCDCPALAWPAPPCLTHRLACRRMLLEGSVLMLVLGLEVRRGRALLCSRL